MTFPNANCRILIAYPVPFWEEDIIANALNGFTLALRAINWGVAISPVELRDCGACPEQSEESPGLLWLRLATASLLAMTLYSLRLY